MKKSNSGCNIFFVKKDGSIYKKPIFIQFVGGEKTAEEVIERLKRLNPTHEYRIF